MIEQNEKSGYIFLEKLEKFSENLINYPERNYWFKVEVEAVNITKSWSYYLRKNEDNKNEKNFRYFLLCKKSYKEDIYPYYRQRGINEEVAELNRNYFEGYLEANVIDMSETKNRDFPFDFSGQQKCEKQNYKTAFCYERVCVKNFIEFIGLKQNEKEKEMLQKYADQLKNPHNFIKLASDRGFSYGDGGFCKKLYPVYGCKSLDFPKEQKQKFVEQLLQLGEKRQDWHENCPVMDIIDPELNPNYDFQYQQNKYIYDLSKIEPQLQEEKYKAYKSLRSKYTWIPTKFRVNNKNLDTKIMGPIHNLPIEGNQELYANFEKAFSLMAKGYKNLNLFENGKDFTDLQVVVKAQKYLIQPKTSYSGKWHLEGKTENIVAAGVYYLKIDQGFKEDNLLFTTQVSYDDSYQRMSQIPSHCKEIKANVQENCSFVFANILPHKFSPLVNDTDKPLERLFINFFIVDPRYPLKEEQYFQEINQSLMTKFSHNISNYIMDFLGIQSNIQKAKENRKKVRENSSKEVSGWGYIHYGNSGDVEFLDQFNTKQNRDYSNRDKYYDELKIQN